MTDELLAPAAVLDQFAKSIGAAMPATARRMSERNQVLDLDRSGQQVVTSRVVTPRGVEDVRLRFAPDRVSPACTCGRSRYFCLHVLSTLVQMTKRDMLEVGDQPAVASDIRVQPGERLARALRMADWTPAASEPPCAMRGLIRPAPPASPCLVMAISGLVADCVGTTPLRLNVVVRYAEREYGLRNLKVLLETGGGTLPFRFADFTVCGQQLLHRLGSRLTEGDGNELSFTVAEFVAMLPWLAGGELEVDGRLTHVLNTPLRPVLDAAETDDGMAIQVRAGLFAGGDRIDPEGAVFLPGADGDWVCAADILAPLPAALGPEWGAFFCCGEEDVVRPEVWRELASAKSEQWRVPVEIRSGGGILMRAALASAGPDVLLYIDWLGTEAQARLEFRYGDVRVLAGSPAGSGGVRARFPEVEAAAAERLVSMGFTACELLSGEWRLADPERLWLFWREELERLPAAWRIFLSQAASRARSTAGILQLDLQAAEERQDWFDLDCRALSEQGAALPWKPLAEAMRKGQDTVLLPDGRLIHIPEQVKRLVALLFQGDSGGAEEEGRFRFSRFHAPVLASAFGDRAGLGGADWAQLGQRLLNPVPPDPELFSVEQSRILRGYQKEGVAWLRLLDECGFHGILADEMGLGKTIQTLTWLEWRRRSGLATAPALVICPTSLTDNWRNEAMRFAPTLRPLVVSGLNRNHLLESISKHDLVITSYALLRRDSRHYRDIKFDAIVLDEAQHIKNPGTENARACKQLQSHARLILTGTPMENAAHELWSLFDFLLPGYLGTHLEFCRRYESDVESAAECRQELAQRIRPFILRRLKADVCQELPPKTERVIYCEMERTQAKLYAQLLLAGRQLISAAKSDGWGKHRFQALSLLTRLRQTCCHPRMLPEIFLENPQPEEIASTKTELLQELVLECMDSGNRVALFSQFTSFLKIFRNWLDKEGIAYEYLDGSTRDRQQRVDRFNQTPSIPIFLVSLKAGGTGLNLTGADTVIHYDPWWNPMVEDQATDRTHRIGQLRPVTAIKLLVRDTLEEKILVLQQRKRLLFQDLLGNAQARPGDLSAEDLEYLLAEPTNLKE